VVTGWRQRLWWRRRARRCGGGRSVREEEGARPS
jgi:hypothetical protein